MRARISFVLVVIGVEERMFIWYDMKNCSQLFFHARKSFIKREQQLYLSEDISRNVISYTQNELTIGLESELQLEYNNILITLRL